MRKISLFTDSEIKQHVTQAVPLRDGRTIHHYQPPLSRLEVVHCNFTGVGFEWDGPHYAVVWNINPLFDAVTVIPTTSEARIEYANVFGVRQISGLPQGNTTLLVGDTTTVSRKRLDPVTYQHPKKGLVNAKLPTAWLDRIYQAMAVTFGGEVTFETFLIERTGIAMPRDLSLLHTWRFMPIRGEYDSNTQQLRFRLWNSEIFHEHELLLPKIQLNKTEKIRLIKDLYSTDNAMRVAAEKKYRELYT